MYEQSNWKNDGSEITAYFFFKSIKRAILKKKDTFFGPDSQFLCLNNAKKKIVWNIKKTVKSYNATIIL